MTDGIPVQEFRKDDLESIEWGTPRKGGSKKLYFNIRVDTEDTIKDKIELMNKLSTYASGVIT